MDSQPLNEAAEKIIQDLDFSDLDDKTKQELLAVVRERIAKRVLATIVDNLQPADLMQLNTMTEQGKSEEAILEAMTTKIPDLQAKVNQALADLYDELVADAKAISQAA